MATRWPMVRYAVGASGALLETGVCAQGIESSILSIHHSSLTLYHSTTCQPTPWPPVSRSRLNSNQPHLHPCTWGSPSGSHSGQSMVLRARCIRLSVSVQSSPVRCVTIDNLASQPARVSDNETCSIHPRGPIDPLDAMTACQRCSEVDPDPIVDAIRYANHIQIRINLCTLMGELRVQCLAPG